MRVSVIVPSFNDADELAVCLPALKRQSVAWGDEFEVIVVDDGSSDGTPRWVAETWPQVRLFSQGKNTGFGAACNTGFEAACGDLAMLLNSDTEPDEAMVATLIETADAHPDVGCFAALMVEYRRPDVVNAAGLRVSRQADVSALLRGEPLGLVPDRPVPVFGPSGGAGVWRRSLLDRIGTLDDRYFMYWEDADLAARAVWAGEQCLLVPRAVVKHKEGATMPARSPLKLKLRFRNRLRFVERVWPEEWMGDSGMWWSLRGRPWFRHGWKLWKKRGRAVGQAFREFDAERPALAEERERIARDRAITLEQFASRLDDPPWLDRSP